MRFNLSENAKPIQGGGSPWVKRLMWVGACLLSGCLPQTSSYYHPSAPGYDSVPGLVNYQTGPSDNLFFSRPWGEIYVRLTPTASKLTIELWSKGDEASVANSRLDFDTDGRKTSFVVPERNVGRNIFRGRHWGGGWTLVSYGIPLKNLVDKPKSIELAPFEVQFKDDRFIMPRIVFSPAFSVYMVPINY